MTDQELINFMVHGGACPVTKFFVSLSNFLSIFRRQYDVMFLIQSSQPTSTLELTSNRRATTPHQSPFSATMVQREL